MILNSLVQIHPIEGRAQIIRNIIEIARENKDIFIFGSLYDAGSIITVQEELERYLYSLEHPQCYRSPDDNDIDLEAYYKMFGEKKKL